MRQFEQPYRRDHVLLAALLALMAYATQASAQDRAKIEIVPLIPHAVNVTAVAFSPNGVHVLSGSQDWTLKLWDVASGKLVRTFDAHSSLVASITFSPDGGRVLSGSRDKTLKIWDAVSGAVLRTFEGHSDTVRSVAFSPDGTRVLSGSDDKTLKLWDAATGELLRTFQGHTSEVNSVAFSPDGTRVLSGSADNSLKLWDAITGVPLSTFRGHISTVNSVAFSLNGARILSGSDDKTLKLWDAATGGLLRTFQGHASEVNSVAFAPDGGRLVSGSRDKTLKLWDTASGQLLHTFDGNSDPVTSVAFSPDGTRLVSGSGRGISDFAQGESKDNNVKLWDTASGQLIRIFKGYSSWIWSVAFSPDGTRLLWGTSDQSLMLWDAATGQLERTLRGHTGAVRSTVFSPDGTRVLSGSDDKTLRLWDTANGQLLRTFEGHSRSVTSIAFSPDGSRALSGSDDKTLKLWDAATGGVLRTFEGHSDPVRSVAFSPDGTRVLSGSQDKTLKLWDAATGRLLRTLEGHTDRVNFVAFSPDGTRVVSGSTDDTLKLWDARTGLLIRTMNEPAAYAVNFSSDGTRLLSGSEFGTLKLWDAATGLLIHSRNAHTGAVSSVAFSPDGMRLLSSSNDTTAKIWDAATGQLLVSLIGSRDGEWLAMTPDGFFAASAKGTDMLSIVRGFKLFSVRQFFDHLYRPDLIEQILKRDPEGKYKDLASKLNLESILNSGPAPQIEQIPERKTERIDDTTVRITLRLVDTGGGIGTKVIWRVNGVTQGQVLAAEGPTPTARGGYRLVTQTLRINPARKNSVEVTAYNGAVLLAAEPYRLEIDKFGENIEPRPRMHILAVGVSDYARKDWRLQYAVKDAEAVAKLLKTAAKGLYEDVSVTLVVDAEATAKGIEEAINRIASQANPIDVFVLFIAGHGRNIAGTYYFFPQDLTFEGGRTVMRDAVGQDLLQGWLAKIPAQKSIMILDTCESAGATRSLDVERETAIERLRHATGRSVIAAASSAAFEGYEGHGLLTYTVLDAFKKSHAGADEEIDLYRLASHVDRLVPVISQRMFGESQRPQNRIVGNFPLGVRTAGLSPPSSAIPKTPTHVLIRAERIRENAASDAQGERTLAAYTAIRVIDVVGDWATIARDGQMLGYVPTEALAKMQ